ncbi:MAG: hypothetical protein JJU29_00050 [Verrucomicrobia bacterium]|nr:hypothetical protein [Verrucomicrobiota bacterium]
MKTTLELPENLFRDAKATAAKRGITLKTFFTEALEEKLRAPERPKNQTAFQYFGALSHYHEENHLILKEIESEFGNVDVSEWK